MPMTGVLIVGNLGVQLHQSILAKLLLYINQQKILKGGSFYNKKLPLFSQKL